MVKEKRWEDLTVNEKLDLLYADLAKTVAAVNRLQRQLGSLTGAGPLREELKTIKDRLDLLAQKDAKQGKAR